MTIGGIGIGSAIAIYFIIWWVVLFAVLPWGVRSQHETGEIHPGSDPGAPAMPHLGRKVIATTVVAAICFAAFVVAKNAGLTLDMLPGPKPHQTL